MEQIHVREANGEVLVFLDKHMGEKTLAMKEAIKILTREVLRVEAANSRNVRRESDSNVVPPGPESD